MKYESSRGKYQGLTSAEVIKMGIAPDGGLFVPGFIPQLTEEDLVLMQDFSYQEKAVHILKKFLTDFSSEQIVNCVNSAYNDQSFDHVDIAPLVALNRTTYIQELWHGPTCAFKDMALQILPHLLTTSSLITGETDEIVILVATSGDTGKAALAGFKDVENTRIIVFYPEEGVSEVQKRQMITQEGKNVLVAAVRGNFDDAQNGVKQIFNDRQMGELLKAKHKKMSSANSINWGRLLPQIVYYIAAYLDLRQKGIIKKGEKINIVVPTGNFGNILAAFYAGKMGIPINKLICASNANNVLTDFIRTGVYDRNRKFEKTISPSMDILISSNLERLLYELTGHDAGKVSFWMEELKKSGRYEVDSLTKEKVQEIFWAGFCDDEATIKTISEVWQEYAYLLDTHTAVAFNVYRQYVEKTGDNTVTVIASTASPFKFAGSVASAVLPQELRQDKDEFQILDLLASYTGLNIPPGIKDLEKKPVLHKTVCDKDEMKEVVLKFLE
ncbi:L-threonine synthase [Thermosyntropha lipolytica DSM 11003]|uniref:Threonine synthase n=1 Tax=Thermosyntropha lipolytica DSM 11003 TaxID=1123382 RepID=A0A1M5RH28_9FIRM|nr:threonine synthase [Thermosyntropha lipolytica]SHH25541.1 L-threonine synthase [Thermosyntropha lipolytica DSM 11003]